jgi:hypothetical protein
MGKTIPPYDTRATFARRVHRLICWWLRGLFIILLLQGFKFGCDARNVLSFNAQPFNLSDTVLTALLAATGAGAIGLMVIILRDLSPRDFRDEPIERT